MKAKLHLSLLFKQKCVKDECHIPLGDRHTDWIMVSCLTACSSVLAVGEKLKKDNEEISVPSFSNN